VLTGGGSSDTCTNNVSDSKIQMVYSLPVPGQFGKLSYIKSKKAILNVKAFIELNPGETTNYLCEKINDYTCNTGSFLFDDLCYTFFDGPVTHAQADFNCQQLGGQLLKVISRKQQTFLNEAFSSKTLNNNSVWLDYRKMTYSLADNFFKAIDDAIIVFNSSGIDFTNPNDLPVLNDPSLKCVVINFTQGYFNGWKTISCLENSSYICQQPQILSPGLIRIIPDKQLLIPLDLYSGFQDLVLPSRSNLGNLVAISTDQFVPSGLIGAAHFLGRSDSFLQIDNVGPTRNFRYQFGISVSMWIYIDVIYDGETQYLIDARPKCNTGSELDEAFTLFLVNAPAANVTSIATNNSCHYLSNIAGPTGNTVANQSVLLIAKLCSFNITTRCKNFVSPTAYPVPVKQWTHIGFSYNAVSKLGSFFIDDHFGYFDSTLQMDALSRYFTYDSKNWLTNSSSVAINAPILLGANKYLQSQAFSGKISCLQWYEGPLTQPQFHYLKLCPLNTTYSNRAILCPHGFYYYKRNCYKFSSKASDFATAEAFCTSTPGK